MAWNEPGKNNNTGGEQGPPDLDKIFKDLAQKFNNFFAGKNKSNQSGSGSNNGQNPSNGGKSINSSYKPILIGGLIVVLLIWAAAGFFIVGPAQQSVVLQFGKYKETVGSGPHWIPALISTQTKVNVQSIATYSYSAQMLTKDQNIVDVSVAVQYRIDNARDYLYNVMNPTSSLQQATASALRQVIGNTTLDNVLTTGRAVVRQSIVTQLNAILNLYHSGIDVTDIALQPAQAPAEVKDAFDDAIKAQEDEQRYQNQAEAYANQVVPIAQGRAQRIIQEAQAYKQQVVLQAQGDVQQFDALYNAYRQSPVVTRERLYLVAIENMLKNSSKVFIDTKNGNNMMYLPLDKMIANNLSNNKPVTTNNNFTVNNPVTPSSADDNTSYANTNVNSSRPSRDYNNPDSLVGVGERP